jgi:hypothetical protein
MGNMNTIRQEMPVVGGYVLLTLVFTFPLWLHLDSAVVGRAVDAESHMWSYWWMRKALLELHTNPFFCEWLYYPDGASLYFYAYNVVHAIVSIPLQQLFGLVVAYNLTEIAGFFAAAWSMSWLARDVTGSRRAGFLAGIIFGFAPTQVFHFSVGQPNIHGVEFLPLYVLCVRRWLDGGGSRWLLGGAIALALNSFSDWQFALYAHLFTALLLLARLFAAPLRQWRGTLWVLGWRTAALETLYVLAVAPVLVPMVREISQPDAYMFRNRRDTLYHSADLLSFLVPNPEHPLWRDLAWPLFDSLKQPGILVAVVSLSYGALVLATFALVQRWKQARFWLIIGGIFLVLSLGPQLRLLGEDTGIILPYELLFQFKIIRVTRAPARYVIITLLCLAVLAAIGVRALLDRLTPHHPSRAPGLSAGVFALLVGGICFELLPAPVRIEPLAPVPAYMRDGTLSRAGGLLELPGSTNRGMYYQTIHERPILYGELSRDNPPGPLLDYLRYRLFDEEIVAPAWGQRCVPRFSHVTHLLIAHSIEGAAVAEARVRRHLGAGSLVQAHPAVSLYRFPPGEVGRACFIVGEGFLPPRMSTDTGGEEEGKGDATSLYRWMGQRGMLGVLVRKSGPLVLHFDAHSFAVERQVQVWHEGRVLASFAVGEPQSFAMTLDLPPGEHWLEFRSVEPAISPSEYGYTEREPVTIAISNLWAE